MMKIVPHTEHINRLMAENLRAQSELLKQQVQLLNSRTVGPFTESARIAAGGWSAPEEAEYETVDAVRIMNMRGEIVATYPEYTVARKRSIKMAYSSSAFSEPFGGPAGQRESKAERNERVHTSLRPDPYGPPPVVIDPTVFLKRTYY